MREGISVALMAAVLVGFGHVAQAGDSDNATPRPQDARRILELKKHALRISSTDLVTVRLVNQEEIEGVLREVTDQGITLWVFTGKPRRQSGSRVIRFDEMQSLRYSPRDKPSSTFGLGIFCGIMGPLGWLVTWAMATGRD